MVPLSRYDTGPFLPHILITGLHLGVIALQSLFLYSDMPPPVPPPSDWLKLFLSQTLTCISTLAISCQLFFQLAPSMNMEQCSKMSAHKIQTSGNHPKERIQHFDILCNIPFKNTSLEIDTVGGKYMQDGYDINGV